MPAIQPPPGLLATGWRPWIVDFLARVEASGIPHGVVWTSWFRDAIENRRVGGDVWSQHQLALGLDAAHPDLGELYRWEDRAEAQGLGALVELGPAAGSENWPYDFDRPAWERRHLHLQRLNVGVLEAFYTTGQWTQT